MVAHLQGAFLDNWIRMRGAVLHGPKYFPLALAAAGNQQAQVFRSSAREGSDSIRLMYMMAVAAARKHIRMANAYFVPDGLSVRMFVAVRKRGVEIEIIVPGEHSDQTVVNKASRANWGALLQAALAGRGQDPSLQAKQFSQDKRASAEYTLAEWHDRGKLEKLSDWAFRLGGQPVAAAALATFA